MNGYGGTDNNGNVLAQEITAPGWATPLRTVYKYDPFNRLGLYAEGAGNETAQTCSGAAAPLCEQFGYEAWGNRLITDRTGVGPASSEPPAFSALTNRISGTGFGYDDFGNLTATPAGTAQYDAENRMTLATTALGTTQYVYDGEGRRVKKIEGTQETVYVYDAMGQLAAEYDGVPATVAGRTYLTQDHLGSTRVVTDASGTVVERRDYLPFGDEVPAIDGSPRLSVTGYTSAAATTLKFTGKERDAETGLDYFGARYFSAAQGRFTSPDEFKGGIDDAFTGLDIETNTALPYADITDPQTLNKYTYVRNNPLRYIDPDGHADEGIVQEVVEFVVVEIKHGGQAVTRGVSQGVGLAGNAAGAAAMLLLNPTPAGSQDEIRFEREVQRREREYQRQQQQPHEPGEVKPVEPTPQDSSKRHTHDKHFKPRPGRETTKDRQSPNWQPGKHYQAPPKPKRSNQPPPPKRHRNKYKKEDGAA